MYNIVQQGKRVAVVDTDLQSPGLHVLFGINQQQIGLTLNDYLFGRCSIEQAYDAPVAGILPVSEEMIELGSANIFSLVYPEHPYSRGVHDIAAQILLSDQK